MMLNNYTTKEATRIWSPSLPLCTSIVGAATDLFTCSHGQQPTHLHFRTSYDTLQTRQFKHTRPHFCIFKPQESLYGATHALPCDIASTIEHASTVALTAPRFHILYCTCSIALQPNIEPNKLYHWKTDRVVTLMSGNSQRPPPTISYTTFVFLMVHPNHILPFPPVVHSFCVSILF